MQVRDLLHDINQDIKVDADKSIKDNLDLDQFSLTSQQRLSWKGADDLLDDPNESDQKDQLENTEQ